jgi:putative ABC transport system substrate-binding protein
MRRRHFISLIAGGIVAGPRSGRAQKEKRLPIVGLAFGAAALPDMAGPRPPFMPARSVLQRLAELGWVEGRSVVIERRTAEGRPERAPALMAELVARGADVIIVSATDWLLRSALQTRTIPLVAIFNEDPVADGLVASLARPGANLTGVTSGTGRELYDKRLQLLLELAPASRRVAFLGRRKAWEFYRGGGGRAEAASVFIPIEQAEDFETAFATVLKERADALLVSHGPVLNVGAARIAAFTREQRLPAVFPWRSAAAAGGLMSYGPDVTAHFRQIADYVDKILRGAKPGELPIEQPTRFGLVINGETAKAFGLAIPPTLLALAEEVIE